MTVEASNKQYCELKRIVNVADIEDIDYSLESSKYFKSGTVARNRIILNNQKRKHGYINHIDAYHHMNRWTVQIWTIGGDFAQGVHRNRNEAEKIAKNNLPTVKTFINGKRLKQLAADCEKNEPKLPEVMPVSPTFFNM